MEDSPLINSQSNIRVAYFAGTMKPGHDGVTRVLYKIIDGLNDNKIENIFISPIIPTQDNRPTKMFKVPSVQFPLYKDYQLPVPGMKHFDSVLNEFKPDIMHINSPCPLGFAAVKYGNKYGIPVVATYHTHFSSYAKYYKVKALENVSWNYFRSLYNKCESVYVPSTPILEELKQHGLKTVKFLPHGVDINSFNPKFKSVDWKKKLGIENKIVLLFAGRLVWEKDLQTLAETYNIINEKRDDVAFVLAGDGPIREELEMMMPNAKFLGYQSGLDLSTTYASSDIFVFPSTTETFGNVTVEAMASGIAPICAREGGAFGIIQEGKTGLISNPRDPGNLAEKIESLLDNSILRKRISQNALEYAKTQTWENILNQLFADYHKVVFNYTPKYHHKQRRVA